MPITAPAARDHTSAAHVISQSMVAQRADTAEELRQQIRQTARSDWELVCVLGDNGRLWGTLMAAELLVMADPTVLGGVAFQEQPRVLAGTDQEKMASIGAWNFNCPRQGTSKARQVWRPAYGGQKRVEFAPAPSYCPGWAGP